ncbi:proline-rich protein 36-like [Helianthus annuus]|uniref:proline-rich protein 36-like n=1 Tax=Helianthus annuus TaxID=4232 RepID=UPI001652FF0F|nr:proline-rich protein 36-like [Helianthus annuus]
MDSSGTGDSDTTGPRPIVSDDLESSEHEVHTSDVTSTNEDDFQPFALPDAVDEPADGPFAGDLPLVEIPAPIPLASYPVLDILLDADADDDVDLFDDEPLEDDVQGEPMEDPVDPVDLADPAFADHADFEMAFDDPEPTMAPEPVAALDPVFEHDPIHAGIPVVDPLIADLPIDDHPVDAPLLEGDHVVAADQADAPFIADAPVDPIVAPLPDPVSLEPEHALFATHIDPRYAHTQNGWIDSDDELPPIPPHTTDARHIDSSFSFAQFTPPARPREGSSAHPFGHVPTSIPVVPQFSTAIPPVPPFSVPPFDPAIEPFLWTSPPVMPPSDPYHPFHMGYSIEDVLMSFVVHQEALTRRIQVLERA